LYTGFRGSPASRCWKFCPAVCTTDAAPDDHAAELLGCTQAEVSALANYKLAGFSMARLLEFLTDLDRDVEISILKTDHHGLEPA